MDRRPRGRWVLALPVLWASVGCGASTEPPPGAEASTGEASTGEASTGEPAGTTTLEPATTASSTGSSTAVVDETTAGSSTDDGATTGPVTCDKNVVLMGYWPPTNEMLRPWSQDAEQNPGGWIGEDWEGYGYDVYSFFPEFPPDGDPSNDPIGSDGAVGSPRHDLRVDYQATSADFWRIVDELRPVMIVTTSRGLDIGWEIEAIEGGHGMGNPGGPEFDWASDQHGAELYPTEASIEPRSWEAISTARQGTTLSTRLPVDDIVAATTALGVTTVVVDQTGTSGNFLSGFLGLHGLYYAQEAAHEVHAAGHVHVGLGLPVEDASALVEVTLRAVLEAHPSEGVACP